jgi:hypothetical protein
MNDCYTDTRTLLLDGARGIYVPKGFAECFDMTSWDVSDSDAEILLAGPDHEEYWDTWAEVLDTARYVDDNVMAWSLYQDGDLWAVRSDHQWEDEDV